MKERFTLETNLIDLHNSNIEAVKVSVENGRIADLVKIESAPSNSYIMPGFVDSHVHIESSMLVPSEFAPLAITHGTLACVSDPHEIANVLGVDGVRFMLENASLVPFRFYFGAPSCVPATSFETSGGVIDSEGVKNLLERDDIWYLSEMMNYPGVLFSDEEVLAKIQYAKELNKPVDGHAPGLRGDEARKYIQAGITSDHECVSIEEAEDKIAGGMKILIREGSAAKNFEALIPLLSKYPEKIMFCSDDKHPDDLLKGHINELVVRALNYKHDLFSTLRAACINPVRHYKLDIGTLRVGDSADFIEVSNYENFEVKKSYYKGQLTYSDSKVLFSTSKSEEPNNFFVNNVNKEDLKVKSESLEMPVIKVHDGQLITSSFMHKFSVSDNGIIEYEKEDKINKLVVQNRYNKAKPAVAFVSDFNLISGALASTVAHDSHNIIAVGASDDEIALALEAINESKGGIAVVTKLGVNVLPLPVAGLMSSSSGEEIAKHYEALNAIAKSLGTDLTSPFMTLSFLALLVIPELKLSDKGLFDGKDFKFLEF